MKKITLLFALLLATFGWQANAQFTESFDTEIPATWTVVNEDGGNTWVHSTTDPHSGAGQVEIEYDTNAHDDYLISPSFTVTAGTSDRVSFYAAIDGTYFTETFDVMLSTTAGTAAADFDVTLASETATDAAPNHGLYEYNLSSYVGQTITIAIRATDTDQYYLYVDDFTVDALPTCLNPSDLATSNIAADGVDIAWTENGSATNWEYVVQAAGTGAPTAAGTTTTTNPTTVTGLSGETDYEVYLRSSCGGGDYSDWVGPVNFTTLPTCPAPTDLASSNVTTNSATITWTDNAGASEWAYVVQPAGGTAPTGTGTVVSSASVDLTGLNPSSTYSFYVRANCSASDSSHWEEFHFDTACGPVMAPYSQNFDDVTRPDLPNCWTSIVNSTNASDGVISYTYGNVSSPNSIKFDRGDDNAELYLISPEFSDLTSQANQITFAAESLLSSCDFIVGTMSDPTDASTFTPFQTLTITTTSTTFTVYFDSNYTGTDHYIALTPATGTTEAVYLDDFVYSVAPTCRQPSDLAVSNVTYDSADISWTNNSSATTWEYVVQAAGTGTPTAAGTATSTNPTTVTGLTPDTDYEVYVRANCGGGDLSTWEGPLDFTTTLRCPAPSDITVTSLTQTTADVSWTNNSTATSFEYVMQAAGDPPPAGAGTAVSASNVSITNLTADTNYDFYVRADCGSGEFSEWEGPKNIYTGYCIPEIITGTATYIDSFVTTNGATNISNASTGLATNNYGIYTTMSVSLASEQSFDFQLDIAGGTVGYAIWVDWNNNYIFDMATEKLAGSTGYLSGPFTGTITVPAGTADGNYRMRLMIDYNDANITDDACTFNGTRGEVEDYTVLVDNSLSVADNQIAGFNYYPNPVNNTLNLSAQDNIEKVSIYNISGQEVMNIAPNAVQTQVDMSRLQNGIYFVKAQINGQLTAFKVVKK